MGYSREAVPRVKQTSPGSKYRYKLTYPDGYVKYVRWPEQMPKEVSNPMDKKRMDEKVKNTGLIASDIFVLAKAMESDFEKIVRELTDINWSYHRWWQKHGDEIVALLQEKYGNEAPQKIREYRKTRDAATSAMADMAGLINEAFDKQG